MMVDWVEFMGSDGVTNVLTCSDVAVQGKSNKIVVFLV